MKTIRIFNDMIAIGPKNVIFGPTCCPQCGNNKPHGPGRLIRDKFPRDTGFFNKIMMGCWCGKCKWKMIFEWEAPPQKRGEPRKIWYPFENIKDCYDVFGITISEEVW